MRDTATARREADETFALELGRQAAETHPGMAWHELEPVLANTWRRGTHVLPWEEAATRVESAWATCRGGGSHVRTTRGAPPTARGGNASSG